MIVKCIKIISCATGKDLGEKSAWLKVGNQYPVYAIRIEVGKYGHFQVAIESESDGEPVFMNIENFEIVSNHIPSTWVIGINPDRDIGFMPLSWFDHAFWEGMDEGTDEAMALFEKEKLLMLKEEGLIPRDS
ncbi:MAG: hypothetical protein U1E78_05985 [Gammaproteobacteria bacterium]